MSTGLSVERAAGGRRRYRDRRFDELPAQRTAAGEPAPPAAVAPWATPTSGVRSDPFMDALADLVIAAYKVAGRAGIDFDAVIATRRGHSTETQTHIYTDARTHIPTSTHQ